MNIHLRVAAAVLGSFLLVTTAMADKWPSRPITVIVTGSSDVAPRTLGPVISKPLGQQIIVDNVPGAGGIIAAEHVLRQPADGYTVFNATSATPASALTHVVPYNVLHDFMPVILIGSTPFIFVTNPSLPVHSIAQLVALAKKHPGELNYSATAPGSSSDLVAELFKADAHINIVHVAYKGMGPSLLAVMGGHVELCSSVGPNAVSQVRAGKVRALAVSTAKRTPLLPNVPTFAEQGYPNIVLPAWYGWMVRKGTSPAIIKRLDVVVNKALQRPDVRARLRKADVDVIGGTTKEFATFLKSNYARWVAAAKAANMLKNPHPYGR